MLSVSSGFCGGQQLQNGRQIGDRFFELRNNNCQMLRIYILYGPVNRPLHIGDGENRLQKFKIKI